MLSVSSVQVLAIDTQSVIVSSLTPFICGYITTRRTSTVVVIHAVHWRFIDFVDGIKRGYLWHRSWSPVKDLGTSKVRPVITIELSQPFRHTAMM